MNGFTGLKDLDKEILLKMSDREFIQTCSLNNYFKNLCDSSDYPLYKKRLELYYPDTLSQKMLSKKDSLHMSWKRYYAEIITMIAELKEKYDFIYTEGDLSVQHQFINSDYQKILDDALIYHLDFPLVVYAINKGAKITSMHMINALTARDMKLFKFLVDNGGDYKPFKRGEFQFYKNYNLSKEFIEYLHSLGIYSR